MHVIRTQQAGWLTHDEVRTRGDHRSERENHLVLSLFFFSSRRRHTRWTGDWSSDVCSSDLVDELDQAYRAAATAQKEWAATTPYARRAVLEKALRVLEDREPEITEAIIAELEIGRASGRERG